MNKYKYSRKALFNKYSETWSYKNLDQLLKDLLATKPESDKESWMCDACGIDHLAKAHEMMDKEELEVEDFRGIILDDKHCDQNINKLGLKISELIKAHNALVKEVKAK